MRPIRFITALALSGAVVATSACMNDSYAPRAIYRPLPDTVSAPVGAYLAGDIVDGRSSRRARIMRAKIAPLAAADAGLFMQRQEAELRRQTVGTGVEVFRSGGDIVLRMPASTTFASGSFAIQPQFQSTLREIAQTLKTDNQTYVDVLGHTDASGGEVANQALSVSRAQAVANYFKTRGVVAARVAVKGYGETAPIATNDTEDGRAANRRLEIRLVPITR